MNFLLSINKYLTARNEKYFWLLLFYLIVPNTGLNSQLWKILFYAPSLASTIGFWFGRFDRLSRILRLACMPFENCPFVLLHNAKSHQYLTYIYVGLERNYRLVFKLVIFHRVRPTLTNFDKIIGLSVLSVLWPKSWINKLLSWK